MIARKYYDELKEMGLWIALWAMEGDATVMVLGKRPGPRQGCSKREGKRGNQSGGTGTRGDWPGKAGAECAGAVSVRAWPGVVRRVLQRCNSAAAPVSSASTAATAPEGRCMSFQVAVVRLNNRILIGKKQKAV